MSVMDKFLKAIQLNGDDDSYYDEDDDGYVSSSKIESINNSSPIGKEDSISDSNDDKIKKNTEKVFDNLRACIWSYSGFLRRMGLYMDKFQPVIKRYPKCTLGNGSRKQVDRNGVCGKCAVCFRSI